MNQSPTCDDCEEGKRWVRGNLHRTTIKLCPKHASVDALIAALHSAEKLIKEALPKFNWSASALNANAITLLNEVPGEVATALKLAKGSRRQ